MKKQQQRKCLLSSNIATEICKTVSRSIAGNQAQKTPHVLHWMLNVFWYQFLQYSSIYILLSLFEELGDVVAHKLEVIFGKTHDWPVYFDCHCYTYQLI